MIELKKPLLTEKTLYHGTIIDNINSIRKYGLLPSVGKFVKNAYEEDVIGCNADPDDYIKELVFSTDKQQLGRAVTAITAQIGFKLNKGFHDVTDDEFIKHGMLVIVKDGDSVMERRPESDDRDWREYPHTVEPGDYYSDDYVGVDIILTGNNMIRMLKRYGVWPRKWIISAAGDVSNLRSELIRLAIKYHKDKPKEEIIKMVNSISKKQHLINKINAYKDALGEKIVHESKIKLSEIKSVLKELIDEEYTKISNESMFPKEFNRHVLGSCMSAAEMATKYFLSKGITDFKIVEGFVSLYPNQEEYDFSAHTWIEFDNGKKFDPTRKQWKQWGFDPDEVKYEKVTQKFTPEQYLKLCQISGNDEIKNAKKQIKEGTIPDLDKKGTLWASKFGQDERDVNSEHFIIKFGTDVVGKNQGVIFFNDKWFACAFPVPKGYGDYSGKWIINPHTASMKMGLTQIDEPFDDLKNLLEFLEKWYRSKFSKINENKINGIRDDTLKRNILLEWHENAKLEAYYAPNMRTFLFFRNGLVAGEIRYIDPHGYIEGFGVQRSLQGTGLGKSMLNYAFEKTGLQFFTLDTTSANAFYHKIGGKREKSRQSSRYKGETTFTIDKSKLKSSPFVFKDIDKYTALLYYRKSRLDPWPSINENIKMLDERIKFADLYDDTDDERIAKSKLPGMRVRSLQVSTNNDRDMWRFDYSYVSSEKSEWDQYREKVGHKGHIYFFKENIEPNDNLEDLECMVDCTCRDFKYRWAYALAQDDASIVGPKSLNKSVNAPPIKTNPLGHQQLCKHLSALRRYVVTNIEKALDQAPYRNRPFSLTEEMDKLANKGKFATVYNSE